MTRMPRACAASTRRMSRRRRRAAGRPSRSWTRRSGGWTRREDRRQVQQVHAELDEVVELAGDAVEVAAVELLRAPGRDDVDRVAPSSRRSPSPASDARRPAPTARSGRGTPGTAPRRTSRRAAPGRRRGEVLGVQRLERVQARLVEPVHAAVLVLEHSGSRDRVLDDDVGLPPVPAVRRARRGRASVQAGSRSGFERVRTAASGP